RVWLQVHGAPPPAQTNLPRGLGQRALSIVVRALAGRGVADPHHAGMVSGHPAPRCCLRPRHLVAAIAGHAPAAGALGGHPGHAGRSGRDTDTAPQPPRVACGPVPATDPHGGPLSAPTAGASVRPPALRARAMAAERRTWRDAGVDAAERIAATGTRGRLEQAL